MTITRWFSGLLLAVTAVQPVLGQSASSPLAPPTRYPSVIPSVAPAGPSAPMPAGRPYAAGIDSAQPTALDRIAAPVRPAGGVEANPVGTLTGEPLPGEGQFPQGSYRSPFYTDGPGCCGPLGRDGRVGYEIYLNTGPTWALNRTEFTTRLQTGWMVGGGGRSLFFDQTHTTAWVVDLGLSYQYNRGESDDPVAIFTRQPPTQNPFTGESTEQPDRQRRVIIRSLDRTNFNFGVGRDWWLWGAGSTGTSNDLNLRFGGLVGGRWGTAHVNLVPLDEVDGYSRRQNVTHGVFVALHTSLEIPMGTWIFFSGIRTEWGHDWTNLVPDLDGDIHNLNVQLTAGIRF